MSEFETRVEWGTALIEKYDAIRARSWDVGRESGYGSRSYQSLVGQTSRMWRKLRRFHLEDREAWDESMIRARGHGGDDIPF